MLLDAAHAGRVEYIEWPAEKKAIDIGSFYADSSKFRRVTGWEPRIPLRDGLASTLEFYRRHYREYVDVVEGQEPA
jgi:UDP-glucose 4-epimerase